MNSADERYCLMLYVEYNRSHWLPRRVFAFLSLLRELFLFRYTCGKGKTTGGKAMFGFRFYFYFLFFCLTRELKEEKTHSGRIGGPWPL